MRYTGRVLALDLATSTGFAYGRPGEKPVSGRWRLGDSESSHGERYLKLAREVREMLRHDLTRPDVVVYEAPLNLQAALRVRKRSDDAEYQMGLGAIVRCFCQAAGVYGVKKANVNDVRRHFLGTTHFPKGEAKSAVIRQCQILGWNPENNDEADALALWDYQCARLNGRHGATVTCIGAHAR